ncbi:MAG: hypothetical protein HLUCCA08_04945 [Rhodobacteraceae bacterium HLUCCA08]|nr:MAG: hypothetical protein HLUCCA08_04945 [Rhodobacteraceae bacterium HLUCCA08]
MKGDTHDPKALIREAYRIEGIGTAECRTIFLDWALSLETARVPEALQALLARHGAAAPDHPMTQVLREGLDSAAAPTRRGGRKGRLGEG